MCLMQKSPLISAAWTHCPNTLEPRSRSLDIQYPRTRGGNVRTKGICKNCSGGISKQKWCKDGGAHCCSCELRDLEFILFGLLSQLRLPGHAKGTLMSSLCEEMPTETVQPTSTLIFVVKNMGQELRSLCVGPNPATIALCDFWQIAVFLQGPVLFFFI